MNKESQQQPPYHEVDVLLRQMDKESLSAQQRRMRLEEALQSKVKSIIDVMRIAAHDNPELQKIFNAMSDSSINSENVSREVYDYPVALELISALENGLMQSRHSSVQTLSIQRFMQEIDRAHIDECRN